MIWYGGSKIHQDTPAIQRLISHGKSVTNNNNHTSGSYGQNCHDIILWCRFFDKNEKAFPYTCFGRLSYELHELNSRPIKFVWNLRDYDILKETRTFLLASDEMQNRRFN